jgi:peptidoglycan/LPS O-acetylase OafA/YrhL
MLPFIPANASQPFIALLIILNLAKSDNLFFKALNNRILVYIGKLSYSLYIWQQLFTVNQPWKGMFKGSDSVVLNLAALALVSYLSYNCYEKFFLKLKTKISERG